MEKEKKIRIIFQATESMYKNLKVLADKQDRTVSSLLRVLVQNEVEKND